MLYEVPEDAMEPPPGGVPAIKPGVDASVQQVGDESVPEAGRVA
jgi:hypothetical protein